MTYIKSAFDVFYTRAQKSCKKKRNLININETYFTLWNSNGYKRNELGIRTANGQYEFCDTIKDVNNL